MPIEKVDVAVQTLPEVYGEAEEDLSGHLCDECKSRIEHNEVIEQNENPEMQLVTTEDPKSSDKMKKQVPKAVEKVLACAIRREIALEEFSARQTAEIVQLNRLVQQYKRERECNVILQQTREHKIIPLESIMDGVLPTEEFMDEEFLSLTNEHKLLKAKYDNNPEILRTKIELKRVQDELNSEKKSMQMVMQGYARLLEQYADLQEKHITLLAKHRKMHEGIEEEKEKRYLMDGNKGLQPQLRDTTEAVQAFEFEPPTYSGYDLCNI